MVCIVKAYVVMAHRVMARIDWKRTAYAVMVYIVMAYVVMTQRVMADIVQTRTELSADQVRRAPDNLARV